MPPTSCGPNVHTSIPLRIHGQYMTSFEVDGILVLIVVWLLKQSHGLEELLQEGHWHQFCFHGWCGESGLDVVVMESSERRTISRSTKSPFALLLIFHHSQSNFEGFHQQHFHILKCPWQILWDTVDWVESKHVKRSKVQPCRWAGG
jgi:hypothetical protein